MKNPIIATAIFCAVLIVACQPAEPTMEHSPLIGVWELESGEWTMEDTTMVFPSPDMDMMSMKYYSDGFFFVIGKAGEDTYSISGTYTYEGDKYTEVIGLNAAGMDVGQEVHLTFSITDDILSLETDWFKETWKRLE